MVMARAAQGSRFYVPAAGLMWLWLLATPQTTLAGSNQNRFMIAAGLGAVSAWITEGLLQDEEKLNFFNVQGEFYSGSRSTTILSQGFAVERRSSHWFSLGLEVMSQQFLSPTYSGFGGSFNPQFRWYLFGKSPLSPYAGYTAGLFYGNTEFPEYGTQFTFRLLYMLGLEYKLTAEQRLRVSFGHLHHSNNNLLDVNPGFDGNGFAIGYAWAW